MTDRDMLVIHEDLKKIGINLERICVILRDMNTQIQKKEDKET